MKTSTPPRRSSLAPAKTRVADTLRRRIMGGTLRFGEALPSERLLSEQLGVGRTIVRQALAELDEEGLLQRTGPRLRTVKFDRQDNHPMWLKQSVVILTPPHLRGANASVRTRWLQYTTLGTIDHLRARNIHAITFNLNSIESSELERLASSRPLGLLVPEIGGEEKAILTIAGMFQKMKVPVVAYGGNPALERFDRVVSNHDQGSYDLTRAVIARGCRSILRFWPQPWSSYWLTARSSGFERALREARLKVTPVVEYPSTQAPLDDKARFDYAVRQIAGFLLEPLRRFKPDALLLASDRDVPYTAAALKLHGIDPGKDVLLGGYDHYWSFCEERAFEPQAPAFSVDKCNFRAGEKMIELLLDSVDQTPLPTGQVRGVRQELVDYAQPSSRG